MTEKSSAVLLYMTMPSLEEGKRIIRILLEEHLIACANLLPVGLSLYRWEGKIEEVLEHVAIAKTLMTQVTMVQKRFQELHPYECPILLTIPLAEVPEAVLGWLEETVGSHATV